jgi:hypothetical protein
LEKTRSEDKAEGEGTAAETGSSESGDGGGSAEKGGAEAEAPLDRAKVKLLTQFKAVLERVMTASKIGTRTWGVCTCLFVAWLISPFLLRDLDAAYSYSTLRGLSLFTMFPCQLAEPARNDLRPSIGCSLASWLNLHLMICARQSDVPLPAG